VDRHRLDDFRSYIYRTHDAGTTWTRIVSGLPVDERTGSQLHVIREDPKQKGLLFAGTETTVFVSFDDGDHWQSLRLNLPSTSIRDMVFHTDDHMNDLVIGTYGRGFWVLDDMSPLREVAAKAQQIASAPAYLFKPGDAIRARQLELGSADRRGAAARAESAVRRDRVLPPQQGADRRDQVAGLRRGRQAGAHHLQQQAHAL